ncbi:MAG: hypothetical protein Q8O13_11210 [Candidatus Omnitrophota bacterium]|nr:hypothetical protein [Candidatus Omnitrophota bacterium]
MLKGVSVDRVHMVIKDKKAQQISEYAIVLALIVSAAAGMQFYVQRGLQARYKGATEKLIREARVATMRDPVPIHVSMQYEPYYTKSEYEITQSSHKQENLSTHAEIRTGLLSRSISESTLRKGSQETLPAKLGD